MDYETVRLYAGLSGLILFVIVFVSTVLWVFRPGARKYYDEAARAIFKEDSSHG